MRHTHSEQGATVLARYNSWEEAEAAIGPRADGSGTQGWHNRTMRRPRGKNGKSEFEVRYGVTYARLARRLRLGRPDRMAPVAGDATDRIVFYVWLTLGEWKQVVVEAQREEREREARRKGEGGRLDSGSAAR